MSNRFRSFGPSVLGFIAAAQLTMMGAANAAESKAPRGGIGVVDDTFDSIKNAFAKYGLNLSSGLDVSYMYSLNNPSSDKIGQHFLDNDHDTGSVDLFEISLGKDFSKPGEYGFKVSVASGRFTRRFKSDWDGSGSNRDTDYETSELEAPELYVGYTAPIGNGLTLKGGKFATLVGNESYQPWANPLYTHSFVFSFAQPRFHTGATATYAFLPGKVSLTAGGVTGWDTVEDNNGGPTFIGQLALTPVKQFDLYVSGLFGPEQACANTERCNRRKRGLVDVVAVVRPIERLSISSNFDWGSEDEASNTNAGRHAEFWGATSAISYDVTNCLTLTARGEFFDDTQASRTGLRQRLWSVTPLAVRMKLTDYFFVRGEYRHDESTSRAAFQKDSNKTLPGQDLFAVDFGYSF